MIDPLTIEGVEEAKEPPKTWTALELVESNSEAIPCLIEPIIPSTGVFSIAGGTDVGKSQIFRQMALSIVRDTHFLNWTINAVFKKVIIVSTEDDPKAVGFLLSRQKGKSKEGLDRIRVYFETENIPEYLEEQLELDPADLIIIDAWSDVFGQNLNDSALIRQTLNIYRNIANKYQCAIGFLHHTGKRTQKLAPSKDNLLSGQGFEAKMRLVIELRNDNNDENFKHLCIVKGNYLPREFKEASYKLEFNPETFLFTNTHERVPFDELATLSDEGKPVKEKLLKPHEIDNSTHLEFLEEVFKPLNKPKLTELKTRLSSVYARKLGTIFGGKRTDNFFDYLHNDLGFINKIGKDRSPLAYYQLSTDHPT